MIHRFSFSTNPQQVCATIPLDSRLMDLLTGLDSSSSTQCLQLLKKLTSEGKTIICTIHTPSALLFDMLDHLYVLAEGCCIYQGPSKKLLSFLNELDLICPENYNPADYLLEIANNDYGEHNHRLTEKIGNGSNCFGRPSDDDMLDANDIPTHPTPDYQDFKHSSRLISSFINQLKQLLLRNYLTIGRDRTMCLMRISIHLIMAVFIGIMYSGIGNDAASLLNIYKFLFFNIFILMFTAFSSLQTSCELKFDRFKWPSLIDILISQFLSTSRQQSENISTAGTQLRPITLH